MATWKNGQPLSKMGVGGSSLPKDRNLAYNILMKAVDLGINYIDMSKYYINNRGEDVIAKVLKQHKYNINVGIKFPHWEYKGKDWLYAEITRILKKLNIDSIDNFLFWDLYYDKYKEYLSNGFLDITKEAKKKGLITNIGFTSIDNPSNLKKMVESNYFDVITLEYNLLNISNEQLIGFAKQKGIEVITFGTLAGGALANNSPLLNKLEQGATNTRVLAQRFVLSNSSISTILSGQSSISQLVENAKVLLKGERFDNTTLRQIFDYLKNINSSLKSINLELNKLTNEDKKYVEKITRLLSYYESYGLNQYSIRKYRKIDENNKGIRLIQRIRKYCDSNHISEILFKADKILGSCKLTK